MTDLLGLPEQDYPGYDLPDELTGEAEHYRDCGTSSEAEVHGFWHRLHGPAEEVGCPWDACHDDEDPDGEIDTDPVAYALVFPSTVSYRFNVGGRMDALTGLILYSPSYCDGSQYPF
jgi:hypothetical protein